MGEALNACRLLKMPLRVRNLAKLQSPNVANASAKAVRLNARGTAKPSWRGSGRSR